MKTFLALPILASFFALLAHAASTEKMPSENMAAENITSAQYATPSTRYGHYALGKPHEYERLFVQTESGKKLALELPWDEVFEDLAPRLVKLSEDSPQQILAIVSSVHEGGRLALIGIVGNQLKILAQSEPIGIPNRWLNPVGVADLDGDGQNEIAAVITPHIGGTLKIYQRKGNALVETADEYNFSNHAYGSPELRLSLPMHINGKTQLVVPDGMRRALRFMVLESGKLVETGRCQLGEPITGEVKAVSSNQVAVSLMSGQRVVAVQDCMK